MSDEVLRSFAISAIFFWAELLRVKVRKPTTYWGDWQARHGPYAAMYQTNEQKAARCSKRDGRDHVPGAIGMACHKCRGILVAVNERLCTRTAIWKTAAHEALHFAHPYWDEERIERAAAAICQVWPWQSWHPQYRYSSARVK